MRYLGRRPVGPPSDDDPLSGIANLFDLGLVFIVGLLLALFGAYHLDELLRDDSEVTITKRSADGTMEIIMKKGKRIEALRLTEEKSRGRGRRLGTAYRLEDGTVVYVPDDGTWGPGAGGGGGAKQ
ncbi:MAG TPA: DUF2149 domain-containing protein [Deltaproteobacteria bacterium]|nr:DUF2149 domain-containing protein [Deltaproteobacteria bacterium]